MHIPYLLPYLDCIDEIGPANFVSKLDMLKGYWQVPLTQSASEISAFVTPDGFFQYTVMPFGLCNAPATFQRLVSKVLGGVPNCRAYLDDIVVYLNDWHSHMTILREVFTHLSSASVTLNKKALCFILVSWLVEDRCILWMQRSPPLLNLPCQPLGQSFCVSLGWPATIASSA